MTDQLEANISREIRLEDSWKSALSEQFGLPYFQQLREFLHDEKTNGQKIFPPGDRIFAAFDATPFNDVKVVIIGQDPYHGPGQANGLCFSVGPGVTKPPSLQNIFKELRDDVGVPIPEGGSLLPWAQQGVLLLNAILTVRAGQAGSHQGKGWEQFTDAVIRTLSQKRDNIVFLLWGNYARNKGSIVDRERHLVLEAPHPSPLARGGFFGSRHFSRANSYLHAIGKKEIDWSLTTSDNTGS